MTKFVTIYRKPLSLLLLLCFVSQNSGWTQVPQAASVIKAQSRSEFSLPDRELSVLPASLGRMEEIWTPSASISSQPRVVLIQDAHGQSEAQKNTQAILEFLHRRLNFSQIIIEGGVGKLDPSRLIYFQEEKFNQAAAGLLFQESEIGGPELFLLAEKNRKDSGLEKVQGWGAEDKTLYLDNLQAYQDLFSLRETASSELAKSLAELQTEASRSMNKELYSFFVLWMDFEAGSLPLEQDIQNIQEAAARYLGYQWTNARLQLDWPMLVRYQELKRREALLNADAADGQAKELLRWAENARVKDSVLTALRNILEKNNDADVSEDRRVFWENFYGAAGSQGFSFERYPDLFLLEGFHILEGEVEGARLFEEVSKLRAMVLEKLHKSSREMELLEGFRDYLLLKKFFRMELTREEFASLEQRFGGRKKIPQVFRGVARKALRYYQLALARDQVMAQNVIRRIKESSSEDEAVILISGGFHRQGMSEVFRKEGIAYAVISPHFSEVEGVEKYEASMTGKTGLFDLSSFKVRAAQWMSDWQGSLPSAVSARRETLEAALIARGLELGATPRSELRAVKPWKDLSAVYDDIDKVTGFKKTPGRKKQDPAIDAFLKFVRYETELREVLGRESDPSTVRILFSALTDWLDGNLTNLLSLIEEQGDRALLGHLLDFSRRNMESPYADSLVEAALRRAELAAIERRREARRQTVRKAKKPLRQQPKRFSARPKSDSVRAFTSSEERTELLRALQAEDLSSADGRARIKIRLNADFFKGANPWLPMALDAVKLSFPKSFEGKTVIVEEDVLPGNGNLRQIRLYENAVDEKNYLFSFIESETLGFSRSSDSFFVSADYTFTHPQFPEETFWVLTTQNFDVSNPQNKFRVITGAKGNLLKVIDASATVHPVYEVYDEAGEKRKGFFVMRMDGLWTPSEDFRGIVRGFPLGRERSQRGTAHDTAYIRVPGKNVYVAPGTEGLKKAEVTVEGRTPVSVKVGGKTYDLILKRNQEGALVDVAREGFYDRIGNFTGTITRFKADSYGRASLGAPITGAQVADASKDGVWVSAALENGALIRTDEWKNLPPSQPYVFEMEKADAADSASAVLPRVISIRLAESKTRPKKTHDFLVLRDFQGKPLDSYKLRIPGDLFEKHAGQVAGFKVHARGENAGRLQIKGKDYQLPGEYRDHPVTLLQFPEEKKLIFIVHSKTRTQIKDAYIYEMEGGEYAGSHSDAASLEKELKLKYKYPFDLSRVWREKIRSEETYEAARVAFEQGDLDAAEQILRGVSLKARRQYRLAQQLLNSWIPKRRALLASGPERNQRRLRRSFEKAAEQDQRQSEEESADEDPLDARSELRAKGAEETVRLVQAENLREQDAHAFRALPTWLRVGDEALDIFSKRRAEIEAQPPHPELTGTLLEFLQTAYEERTVPFALERWIADAYEKKLRKIREKEFRIYLFDWIDLEDAGQVAAYYDEKANRLFLSRELLEVMRKRAEGGHSLRQGLLFEMLFPSRKVAVLGASGMVGREVYDLLRRVYPEVIGTSFSSEDEDLLKLDVTREEEVDAFLNRVKPDVVVYAAGVAGVEEAEKNKARAELLNVSVPERIAKIFPGQLVYFSSDYVFDGTEAPYKPKAETKPLNFYGETKARGETAVLNETGNTVIRLGLVYGTRVPQGGDPFHQVIEWIEGKGESKLVLDDKQIRHPVWAGDVAGVVLQTINTQKGGIVQLNGAEDLSRYRFAEEVSEIYRRLYPSWLESPGSNLTSTQMWQWRESDEVSAAAGAAARPQDAKMRNTVRPTRLEDVLRYLIPLYSVPDEGFFQELYAAFETGNFEAIQKISKTLENRSVRWAFVGRPEDLPGASENGVRIWNDSEREELYRYLIRDTKVQTSNAIRIRRVIDSMLMGIPEDKKGIVFLKPMTMGDEPNVELSLFPSFAGPKSMMYLLSYGYMEASSMGRILRFWVPTQRESDDEINETVKTELAGGSYSKIARIINPDGTTVIEKRAKISEDKGKLLAEARHMQSLQKSGDPAGRWFPEIFSIEEHDGWTVVRMQDLSWPSLSSMIQQAFPTGDDAFGQMVGRPYAANQSLMESIKMIYKTLTPDFYSQEQAATPEDFAEKYHFEKLEQRWREASEKSPWMRKLLEAPYLEFSGEREPLVLNLPTMLRIYRRINKLHPEIFKPPYLSRQHGDLHTGNILVDPFDFLKTGRIRDFKLIDPKYIPEGNDPLYDFAKLIHNYFGHYDLALNHSETFHFNVTLPPSGKGPAIFENYFDDEASGTLMTLGRIDHFSKDFMRFIMDPGSDELFPFEPDPVAWRKRLLFTHASLMAGLLPFHVLGDNKEQKAGVIYARSAQLLGSFLEAIAVSDELGDSQDALQLRLRLGEVEIAKAGNNKKAFEEAVARLEQYLDLSEGSEQKSVTDKPGSGKRSELRSPPFDSFEPEENIWVRQGALKPFPGVTLQNIARAQKMLRHFWAGIGEIQEEDSRNGRFQVPLVESAQLNVLMEKMTGLKNRYYLYYLPELPEGSFKPYLAADLLDRFFDHPENLAKLEMVVAESTGNQGKAVASLVQKLKQHPDYAPYAEKLKAVIFVPRTANPDKVRAMKDLGAAVVNRRFSAEELRRYVQADQAGRLAIEAASSTPYFEDYKDASAYVSAYAAQNPETSHYIRHGAPMGVAAYAVIMLEALDQWYRLQFAREGTESPRPVSSSDFDAFIKFVAERPEFSNIRFWVPGGSAGLGSGIAQIKQVRPDVEVFLTQVPGVDHVFKSLQAGHLIPKDQASFDPEALRYVDGIAATAEETTYEIVRSMADAVMRVPHEDNNKMARLILSLGIQYKNTENVWRYLESELSPFLPLTNAVYSQFFQSQLPSLGASGKHILIPITGRTMDAALEAEIKDIPYHAAYDRLQKAAGRASARSELRTLDEDDRQRLKKLEAQITDRKTEGAVLSLEEFRKEAEAREPSEVKDFILQNLRVYEARLAFDEGRFEEARRLLDLVAEAAPDFKDASSTRTVEAHRELLNLFEKYKARIESEGYEFVRKLGTGTFGDGYLFRKREDGSKAVLKVIGGTSLDMKDAIERMSASGQLAVEIDVNDKFFAAVGEDPEKAVIPRNILVYEEENELGLSMPEAIVMNFLEGRPASDFLLEATEDDRRIFFEQVEDRWLDLLRDLKAGGYLLLDYRPDNFFFKIRDGNLVIESVDRGIMSAYPDAQDESLRGRRELSAVGAVGVWKDITGQPAALDFRDRIRAVFDLEPETEAYMKKAVRQSDEARISEFGSLLRSLGFDFRGDDGKIGHSPDYKPLETAFNLVLIPHGVTDANKRNVFHGRADSKDENLINDEGRRQAAEGAPVLAEMIRSLGLSNEDLIFLRSPLRRTGQTAEISLMELQALIPGLPLEALVDPDVTELSFGEWDGKTLAEIEAEFGSEEKENAQQLRILNAVMRAPSGENFLMLLKRVRGVLESWNMKYPGKTVVVYGHGTFAAAVRVLMQSPEARVSDYVTWRDGAVPPRGMPTLFPARSELRDSAGSRSLEFAREVGVRVTGGVFSIAAAVQLVSESLPAASAFAAQERLSIPDAEREQSSRVFSQLLALGGKAILPAQVIEAVTPRARELFVELFVQGAEQVVSPEASVYIAGESAAKIKETFFTYGIFQKKPSAQKLFEIHPQQESIIANRLNRYAVAVSLADAPSGDSLDGRIPAFLIRPEEIRKLGESDQARLLVRMTQLQLLAAVELKDQLDEAGKSRPGARAVAQFLQKAGVGFTSGVGGYWMPSVQSLLSENVAARLAAYAATVKSA